MAALSSVALSRGSIPIGAKARIERKYCAFILMPCLNEINRSFVSCIRSCDEPETPRSGPYISRDQSARTIRQFCVLKCETDPSLPPPASDKITHLSLNVNQASFDCITTPKPSASPSSHENPQLPKSVLLLIPP